MDFEALGRYTLAVETVKKVGADLDKKLKDLANDLNRTHADQVDKYVIPTLDVVALRERFEEITNLYVHLEEQCREANLHATKCGRQPFSPIPKFGGRVRPTT